MTCQASLLIRSARFVDFSLKRPVKLHGRRTRQRDRLESTAELGQGEEQAKQWECPRSPRENDPRKRRMDHLG